MCLHMPFKCRLSGELFGTVVEHATKRLLIGMFVNMFLEIVHTARRDFVNSTTNPKAHLLFFVRLLSIDMFQKMFKERAIDVTRMCTTIPPTLLLFGFLHGNRHGCGHSFVFEQLLIRRLKRTTISVHFNRFFFHLDNAWLTTTRSLGISVSITSRRWSCHLELIDQTLSMDVNIELVVFAFQQNRKIAMQKTEQGTRKSAMKLSYSNRTSGWSMTILFSLDAICVGTRNNIPGLHITIRTLANAFLQRHFNDQYESDQRRLPVQSSIEYHRVWERKLWNTCQIISAIVKVRNKRM